MEIWLKEKIAELSKFSDLLLFSKKEFKLKNILESLYSKGIQTLLVEGGASVHAQFLNSDLYDELRVSIAPVILGNNGASRFNSISKDKLELVKIENLEGSAVHFYKFIRNLV